ncbi:MAG: sigma-70 family RNA polymerase sigma factor [Bacteroidales bacterium]|nr:sigma-70 family RNA polymerase sigma factor [Bacteroidales bacterium]
MENHKYTDQEIMDLFAHEATREHAMRIIVKQYGPLLYSRIRSVVETHDETDDVLQNTLIKVWRALPSFRLDSSLYTWLYRIATNESLSYMRRNRRDCSISISDNDIEVSLPSETMESPETGDEIAGKLSDAVETLPDKQKQVFCMKYFQEMKYDDMATILNTSVGALKASYHHAVKKIQNFLSL